MPDVTSKNPVGGFGVIDLFSGVGGLSLGAARAGFLLNGAVEIDPHAIASHCRNFPKTVHISEDVSRLTGQGLRSRLNMMNGELAGIIGGPPCQGFSSIGKRVLSDPRNSLFGDFFRIVAEAQPKFFLAENVPGILKNKYAQIKEKALSYVEKDYVLLPPMTICARDFGAPTTRTRVFFYGYRRDEVEKLAVEDFLPAADVRVVKVRDALNGLPIKINADWQSEEDGWRIARTHGNGFYNSRLHGRVPIGVGDLRAIERLKNEGRASGSLGTAHSKDVVKRFSKIECGKSDHVSKSMRLDPNGFCPTIRAGTDQTRGSFQAVRPLHPSEHRVITPREAARLQGFPDWFQFSPTKWHSFRQIGNSVSPILAERILTLIYNALGGEETGKD
jgi:DNA (cytosine-5)-methyltransferase 1